MIKIDESMRNIIGKSASEIRQLNENAAALAAKPEITTAIMEAWTPESAADAIIGCCGGDVAKLRKGLLALSKGQLKKVYCLATGTAEAACDMDEETEKVADKDEKKESKAEEKKEEKAEDKKEDKKD